MGELPQNDVKIVEFLYHACSYKGDNFEENS